MMKSMLLTLMAVMMLVAFGCTNTQQGAVIGGAVGAGSGYLIGDANGDNGATGAVVGGVVGAGAGGLIGHEMDKVKYCPACGREYMVDDQYCSVDGTPLLAKQ